MEALARLFGQGYEPSDGMVSLTAEYDTVVRDESQSVTRFYGDVWSPGLGRNIGYVWVPIDLAGPGTPIDVESEHGSVGGRTAAIPFVDPRKERPAGSLRRVSR